MKFLTVLLVVAVAVGCQAYKSSWQEMSQSTEERNSAENNWQTNQQVDQQVSAILAASKQDVASYAQNANWNNFATAHPEAAPYQQKIYQRLQNSPNFASKQHVQQNILNLALEKLNVCKNMSTQQLSIDRGCLGRFTGQMMQLISAIENVSRDHPSGTYPTGPY